MKRSANSAAEVASGLLRFSVVELADVKRIHELSLRILAETGILLHYPPARQLLAAHGANVDEARQMVRIPRQLVEQALVSAPREVTVYSHSDPRHDYRLCLDGPRYARTTTALNWILDAHASLRRPVIEADVVNWTRVIHAMPNLHFAGSLNDQEEAAKSKEVRCLARMLHHTDKPFMFSAFSGEGMRWLWRLAEVVQDAGRLPRLMVLSSVNKSAGLWLGPVRGRHDVRRARHPRVHQFVGGGRRHRAGHPGRERGADERRDVLAIGR